MVVYDHPSYPLLVEYLNPRDDYQIMYTSIFVHILRSSSQHDIYLACTLSSMPHAHEPLMVDIAEERICRRGTPLQGAVGYGRLLPPAIQGVPPTVLHMGGTRPTDPRLRRKAVVLPLPPSVARPHPELAGLRPAVPPPRPPPGDPPGWQAGGQHSRLMRPLTPPHPAVPHPIPVTGDWPAQLGGQQTPVGGCRPLHQRTQCCCLFGHRQGTHACGRALEGRLHMCHGSRHRLRRPILMPLGQVCKQRIHHRRYRQDPHPLPATRRFRHPSHQHMQGPMLQFSVSQVC